MSMTVTLHLPPELEARIMQNAARHSQPIEQYLLSLVERDATSADADAGRPIQEAPAEEEPTWAEVIRRIETGYVPTPEEQKRAFQQLLRGIHTGVSLTDEDLSRENLYEDRW